MGSCFIQCLWGEVKKSTRETVEEMGVLAKSFDGGAYLHPPNRVEDDGQIDP